MEFHVFHIITFLMLVVMGTNAAMLPSQLYWKSMLPNTTMPKAITNLLKPAAEVGYWSVAEVAPQQAGLIYLYAIAYFTIYARAGHNMSNSANFFLEKDFHDGKKLSMIFSKTNYNVSKFMPKEIADSIPLSSNKMENILHKFSIKKGSKEYKIVKNTIYECEYKAIKGEEKLCVTSLESMVDFAISKLGNNVEAISTEVEKESNELQQYVISKGVKKLGEDNKVVTCHTEKYPYAVFYCHKTNGTNAYFVPLESVDGNRVKAAAICHTDTSQWNPKHLAFQVLKVQPGTVPICHFLPQDHVVWVSK
ncbi:hypothetical protein TSUD_10070 [Trifolium subterraneum]|nr:hypothetical protein TSUD_10070 [Trifolium subterraneum]